VALVELGRLDAGAQPQVRAQAVLVGQRVQVGQDLGLGREAAAPPAGLERERVQAGRHVAGGAGIGVIPPDAAQVLGLVHDQEVVDARPLERHGHAQAAEPGAHHDHAICRLLGHRALLALCMRQGQDNPIRSGPR
jgi:hypothetical protein